jgi:hypothetical protein
MVMGEARMMITQLKLLQLSSHNLVFIYLLITNTWTTCFGVNYSIIGSYIYIYILFRRVQYCNAVCLW